MLILKFFSRMHNVLLNDLQTLSWFCTGSMLLSKLWLEYNASWEGCLEAGNLCGWHMRLAKAGMSEFCEALMNRTVKHLQTVCWRLIYLCIQTDSGSQISPSFSFFNILHENIW